MISAASISRRDRIAIAASIALHCCALAAWALVPRPSFPVDEPDERTLFAQIIRLQHLATPRPAPRVALVPAPVVTVRVPAIHVAVAHEHAVRKLVVAKENRAVAPVRVVPSAMPRTPRVVAVAASEPVATTVPMPAATAAVAAAAAGTPGPAPVSNDDGIGNFGESYPASIEPSARSAVLGGVAGVVVRIAVDENGRATAVDFVRAPADPAQRDELRARLLAAHFIPAACNGLRCAGVLVLRS